MTNAKKIENHETPATVDEILEVIFRDRLRYAALLSAAVDHELHTPLVIIRGLAESLLRKPGSNEQARLQEISREAEHLLKILDAMSFVSPADPIQMQNVSLKEKINQVVVFFEKSCLEKGISIRVDVEDHLRIESEPNRLKSILIALMQNAVDSFKDMSGNELKSVTIHARNNKEHLHLIISDTGEGMSIESQNHINNEIFSNRKNLNLKSHMGLTLAQKMANDLKIKLAFVSEKSRGTTFTLTFVK